MAKRRLVVGLALISLAVGPVLAQSSIRGKRPAQKPIFNEKLGTVIITGFSKAEVWEAALSVLKAEKMDVAKTSENFIFSRQSTGARVEVDFGIVDHPKADAMRPWAPAVVLGVDVPEFGELGEFRSMNTGQRTALSRQLATNIINVLFGPPAKQTTESTRNS